jgi:RimJ/RimL family protein N-acetyltransferase
VDRHVVLRRDQAPFTRVEYERASALLELVEAITTVRDLPTTYGWVEELTDDTTVWVRLARPEDTWAVEDLHQRASEQSIYQRYFTPKNTWREENLRRVSGGHRGATLVVTDRAHHVIALCNIFPESEDNTDSGEIAILVDDSWHRRGLGSMLIRHSEEIGERLGFRRLVAYVLANNAAMQGLLRSHDWTLFPSPEFGPGINAFEKKV